MSGESGIGKGVGVVAGYAVRGAVLALERLLPRVPQGDRVWIVRQALSRRRHSPGARALAGFFDQGLKAWKNAQYDIHQNGEAALLARLRPFRPRVLLDVGANVGEWSRAAAERLPDATVHAFEIADATADALEAAVAPFGPRVVANRCGLSDREGEFSIYLSPGDSTSTSLRREALDVGGVAAVEERRARVLRGDDYLDRAAIARVDLLKIDVEGAEREVLAGFEGAFGRGAIDLVQFEYGPLCAASRFLLADFHAFLGARGFALGRLLPEGVDFQPFRPADEDLIGCNYLACLRRRTDLMEALRGPPLRFA